MRVHKLPGGRLIEGEALEALRCFGANRFDSVVTDPPYELGFMGKAWDATGIANSAEFWREVLRVLKPGGHLLAFGGTRTAHRMVCAIEDAGFEVRDSLHWFYGSGFPKSKTAASGMPEGQGTALKPAHEPICLGRKPLIGTISENIAAHGTAGLQIDACRIETAPRPVMAHNDRAVQGGSMSGVVTGASPTGEVTTLGRWPANILLDEDAAEELDAQSGQRRPEPAQVGAIREGSKGLIDFKQGSAPTSPNDRGDGGGASRFFYVAKPSRAERDQGCAHLPAKSGGEATDRVDDSAGTKNPRAGAGRNGGARNYHPTVKPIALMRYLVRLVTPPGGTVLDPFTGSGTTGIAARLEGLSFVGIEREAEYATIASARIQGAA